MTVLVTGASGFLGGALVRALCAAGHTVRILARASSKLEHLADLPLEIHHGAVEQKDVVVKAVAGTSIVFNCAALASDWGAQKDFIAANVTGVQHVLEGAKASGTVKRIVHISTTDVYGYPKTPCDEAQPMVDVGLPYNHTKVQAEREVWRFFEETQTPVTVLRPATIYGPRSQSCVGEISGLLSHGKMVLIDRGRVGAGLLYIDNAVDAILRAAVDDRAIGQAYNLRDDGDQTWKTFIEALAAALGVKTPRQSIPSGLAYALAYASEAGATLVRMKSRPLLTRHAVHLFASDQNFPIGKVKRELGFQSKVGFSEALQRSAQWAKSVLDAH